MANHELFDEFTQKCLDAYNADQAQPVNKFDRYFQSYFIGILSVLVTNKAIENSMSWANVGSEV